MANNFFPKLNFTQFMNRNVKILSTYKIVFTKFEGCSLAGTCSINFSNLPYICNFFPAPLLPCQDGAENRDKAYFLQFMACTPYKGLSREWEYAK